MLYLGTLQRIRSRESVIGEAFVPSPFTTKTFDPDNVKWAVVFDVAAGS